MGPSVFVSDRHYLFDAQPETVWQAMARVEDYRVWWPWLRRFEARGLVAGDHWHCTIQPPLPYPVHFALELGRLETAALVTAAISGDVEGAARLELGRDGGGCRVRVRSELVPASRALQVVVQLAGPLAQFAHAWVFDLGAEQFSSQLIAAAARPARPAPPPGH